jgi:hypothetical protein
LELAHPAISDATKTITNPTIDPFNALLNNAYPFKPGNLP